jgi:hypothetical protein
MLVHMRTRRIHVIGFFLAGTNASVHAQCLEDTNGDGHPIFGHTFQRVNQEPVGAGIGNGQGTGIAFGDLDADGDIDVVVAANLGADGGVAFVAVLVNEADGVYASPEVLVTGMGWETTDVALADLDGDGDLDVVAANGSNASISIFFNRGDANFGGQVVHPVGNQPRSVVAADLDADGDTDLAVLNVAGHDVSVLLNAGDGSFGSDETYFVGNVTQRGLQNFNFAFPGPFMAAGDLDADADEDLAIPAGGQVKIMVNDGAGSFSLAPEGVGLIGFNAYDIVIGDFNGDGLSDVAAVMTKTPATAVNVALNEGGMTFADPVAYDGDFFGCPGCFYNFMSIDAGDLDNDGDLDLVIGSQYAQGFAIFRNRGDGSFDPVEMVECYQGPWVVELRDVSGDGWTDAISLTIAVRSGMRINLNDGEGNLIRPELSSKIDALAGSSNDRMAAGDLNADGFTDMASVRSDTTVSLFQGHDDGTFTVLDQLDVPLTDRLAFVAMGDLNGDGQDDLVLADRGAGPEDAGAIWPLLNAGEMMFELLPPIELDTQAREVRLGDMDGDGDLDVVAWVSHVQVPGDPSPVDRRAMVLLNDGLGNLMSAQDLTFASHKYFGVPAALELGDIDADGDLDVVAGSGAIYAPGQLTVMANDGKGLLSVASAVVVQDHPQAIRLRDFDGDGDLDLALMANHNFNTPEVLAQPYLSIAMNDGSGAFTFEQEFVDANSLTNGQMVAADFDGDGAIDLAIPDVNGSMIVQLNDGTGDFGPAARYTSVDVCEAAAAADVDLDGRIDLLVGNKYDAGIMIFRNRLCPPCPADLNADGDLNILDFITFQQLFLAADPAADCDGDGELENPLDFVCFQQAFVGGCP